MCKQVDAELAASQSPTDRGKRLRVHAMMVYDIPLEPNDIDDPEIIRLIDAYEIPALTIDLRMQAA